jgi:hypothetical protein
MERLGPRQGSRNDRAQQETIRALRVSQSINYIRQPTVAWGRNPDDLACLVSAAGAGRFIVVHRIRAAELFNDLHA